MKQLKNHLLTAALITGTLSYTPDAMASLEQPNIEQQMIEAASVEQRAFPTPYTDYRTPSEKLSTTELVNGKGSMLIDTSESKDNWVLMINNSQSMGFHSGLYLSEALSNDPQFMQHFDSKKQAVPYLEAVEYHMDDFKNRLMMADAAAPFDRHSDTIPEGLSEEEYLEYANRYANFDVFTLDERFFDYLQETFEKIAPPEQRNTVLQYTEAFGVLHEIEHTNERNATLKKQTEFAKQKGDVYAHTELYLRSEIESDLTPAALIYKDMLSQGLSNSALEAFGETVSLWRINDTNHGLSGRLRYYYSDNKEGVSLSHDGQSHVLDQDLNHTDQMQRQTHVSDIPIQALTAIAQQNPEQFMALSFEQARSLSASTADAFLNLPEMQTLLRSNRLSTGHHFTLAEREALATQLAQQVADTSNLTFDGQVQYPWPENSTDGPSAKNIEGAGFTRIMTQAPKESPLLATTFWHPESDHTPLSHAVIKSYPYDSAPAQMVAAVPQNTYNIMNLAELYKNVPNVFYSHTLDGEGPSYILMQLDEENGTEQLHTLARELAHHGIETLPMRTNGKTIDFMPELAMYESIRVDEDKLLSDAFNEIAPNEQLEHSIDPSNEAPAPSMRRGR